MQVNLSQPRSIMAQNKLISAFLFLLLIFSHKIQCNHGGKLHGGDSANEAITKESPPTPPAAGVSQPPPPAGNDNDDFRPTTPGHRPGAGHSLEIKVGLFLNTPAFSCNMHVLIHRAGNVFSCLCIINTLPKKRELLTVFL
jgi:hypothetical protein